MSHAARPPRVPRLLQKRGAAQVPKCATFRRVEALSNHLGDFRLKKSLDHLGEVRRTLSVTLWAAITWLPASNTLRMRIGVGPAPAETAAQAESTDPTHPA